MNLHSFSFASFLLLVFFYPQLLVLAWYIFAQKKYQAKSEKDYATIQVQYKYNTSWGTSKVQVGYKLLRKFKGALVRPDRVDTHAAPAFLIDVVESDGLAVVERLLLRCTLTFRFVVSRHDIRARSAARFTVFTVFLDELEDDDALVQGVFKIICIHNAHRIKCGSVGRG